VVPLDKILKLPVPLNVVVEDAAVNVAPEDADQFLPTVICSPEEQVNEPEPLMETSLEIVIS